MGGDLEVGQVEQRRELSQSRCVCLCLFIFASRSGNACVFLVLSFLSFRYDKVYLVLIKCVKRLISTECFASVYFSLRFARVKI